MNITHHNGPVRDTTTHLIHEAIATRAYEIWLHAGRPDDQAESHWLQAEQELLTGRRQPRPGAAL